MKPFQKRESGKGGGGGTLSSSSFSSGGLLFVKQSGSRHARSPYKTKTRTTDLPIEQLLSLVTRRRRHHSYLRDKKEGHSREDCDPGIANPTKRRKRRKEKSPGHLKYVADLRTRKRQLRAEVHSPGTHISPETTDKFHFHLAPPVNKNLRPAS